MKYLLGGLLAATLSLTAVAAPASSADGRFRDIYTREWAWRTGQSGISSSGEIQPGEGRLQRSTHRAGKCDQNEGAARNDEPGGDFLAFGNVAALQRIIQPFLGWVF